MSTTTEIRTHLGNLADIILPHLMGKPIASVNGMTDASRAADADIEIPGITEGSLFPFQRAGVAFALKARRALIGDEMGLGKTRQAIAAIVAAGTYPALIVCPPSLTLNWVRELRAIAPGVTVERLSGTKTYKPGQADVYVIGDAVLAAWHKVLMGLDLRALVIDESHRMKNRDAKRTKAAKAIARKVDRDGLVLLLSGTAIKNRHLELLSQVEILGLTDSVFGGVFEYLNRFCPKINQWQRGSADGEALHAIMRDTFYVRRLRDDVLDLPGKERLPVVVEMAGEAARDYKRAEEDLRAFLTELRGAKAADKAMRAEAIVKLGVLRRAAGLAKIASTVDYVNNLVEQDEQVIVFAWHRDVVKAYAEAFGADTIMGGDSVDAVEAAKARFQAGESKVIVLNIEAGGVGHTLTAAAHVVFAEYAWTPGDMRQCEDRADRIGQTRKVLSHWLIAGNGAPTIDEHLVAMLNEKGATVGTVLDGKADVMVESDSVQNALLAIYGGEA